MHPSHRCDSSDACFKQGSSLTVPNSPLVDSRDAVPTNALPRISIIARVATLAALTIPFAGLVTALVFLWGWGFSWVDFGLLFGGYALTALGVTVGFHRLFTHRSFETNQVVQFILAVLGSMAVQGSVLKWAAFHRRHHQHSDTPDDPHSPHHQGTVARRSSRLLHSHIGWAFRPDPEDLDRYAKDLRRAAGRCVASALFPLWIVSARDPSRFGRRAHGTWMGFCSV